MPERMSLKKRFRQIKKFPDWVFWLPAKLIMLLRHTMRTEVVDPHNCIRDEDYAAVTITWHNRLLFFPAMFPPRQRRNAVAVISSSRDGQYIADLVKHFGLSTARGSSSKRAAQVLHEAVKAIRDKRYVSFTPDGPRGPKYSMSQGPIYLASQMGVPIIPIAVNYSDYWELKSWDRFQIPKPWAKITLVMGEPFRVPSDLSEGELEQWRQLARRKLMEISQDKPA